MWYVIQTTTGSEEELVLLFQRMIPKSSYEECFYIKRECAKKAGDKYEVYLTALFPAYVFVCTETPEELYYELKRVPKLTKLLMGEDVFLRVSEEEEVFLKNIQDEDHVVRRSLVQTDEEGQIVSAEGALGIYLHCMVRQRLRKRYVWIEQWFLGKKRQILLGIKLVSDEEQRETFYGN